MYHFSYCKESKWKYVQFIKEKNNVSYICWTFLPTSTLWNNCNKMWSTALSLGILIPQIQSNQKSMHTLFNNVDASLGFLVFTVIFCYSNPYTFFKNHLKSIAYKIRYAPNDQTYESMLERIKLHYTFPPSLHDLCLLLGPLVSFCVLLLFRSHVDEAIKIQARVCVLSIIIYYISTPNAFSTLARLDYHNHISVWWLLAFRIVNIIFI